MEQIQEHFLQDIFRLQAGVILEVNKYETIRYFSTPADTNIKKTKLKGISNTYRLEEDVKLFNEQVVPKGSIICQSSVVAELKNPANYGIALRSSGGTIIGNIESHRKLYQEIDNILKIYE